MNYKEIIQALKDAEITTEDFAYEDYTSRWGNVKEVDSHGGEGEGEDWWRVFLFEDHGVYIKIKGWYQSHSGTDIESEYEDCCSEVKPVQKTITVYK